MKLLEKMMFAILWLALLNKVISNIYLKIDFSVHTYSAITLLLIVTTVSIYKNTYSSTLLFGLLLIGAVGLIDILPIIIGTTTHSFWFKFILEFQVLPLALCIFLFIKRKKRILNHFKLLFFNN